MKKSEILLGISTNTRLREDVFPILQESLALESDGAGRYRSPRPGLENVRIVEAKIADLVRFTREGLLKLSIVGGDTVYEEGLLWGETQQGAEAAFTFRIPQPPVFRYLARKEDAPSLEQGPGWSKKKLGKNPVAVTAYPNTFEILSMRDDPKMPCRAVEGNVEAYLRNGVLQNARLAMDMVRSGKTAEKYNLVPIRYPLATVYPTLIRNSKLSEPTGLAQMRIGQLCERVVELGNREGEFREFRGTCGGGHD